MLTRQEMARIIREDHGSVCYKGRIIKDISQIPSEAELSVGNPELAKDAEKNILAKMEELKAELALLKDKPEEESKPKVRKAAETTTSASTAT